MEMGNLNQRMVAALPCTDNESPVLNQERAAILPKNLPGPIPHQPNVLQIEVKEAKVHKASDSVDAFKDNYVMEVFDAKLDPPTVSQFSIKELLGIQLDLVKAMLQKPVERIFQQDQAAALPERTPGIRDGNVRRPNAPSLPTVIEESPVDMDIYNSACLSMGYEALKNLKVQPIPVKPASPVKIKKRWYDKLLLSKNPRAADAARQYTAPTETSAIPKYKGQKKPKGSLSPPPTQQFGVSLAFIKENNANMVGAIPPVVRQCVEFLSQPDALETEGIFRRSANMTVIKELQRACNRGEPLRFRNDPHNAAVLLKTFFRDLEEPLLTFDLYDEIMDFQNWSARDKPRKVKILILERLPLDNYKLLKYVFQFLWKVQDRSCLNKMTTNNLAVVFGPNLAWPPNGQMSLLSIAPINNFTDFLLAHQESIFII